MQRSVLNMSGKDISFTLFDAELITFGRIIKMEVTIVLRIRIVIALELDKLNMYPVAV